LPDGLPASLYIAMLEVQDHEARERKRQMKAKGKR
jgi:hypothetical protein